MQVVLPKNCDLQKQNLAGRRILVVDDLPINIEVLAETLQSERFNVFKASNGKVALEIAAIQP